MRYTLNYYVNSLRPAEEQIEVPELEPYALSRLAHELVVTVELLGVHARVRGRQQQPRLALARVDHERAHRVRDRSSDLEFRCKRGRRWVTQSRDTVNIKRLKEQ